MKRRASLRKFQLNRETLMPLNSTKLKGVAGGVSEMAGHASGAYSVTCSYTVHVGEEIVATSGCF